MWYSSCENGAFLLMEATVCCRFYYWSEIKVVRTNFIVQSTYTSAIEQLLLKWNGCDCDGSMHDAIGFTAVMWQRSKNWIGGAESFNSRKLPGHFSYSLGTRLGSPLNEGALVNLVLNCSLKQVLISVLVLRNRQSMIKPHRQNGSEAEDLVIWGCLTLNRK